MPAISDFGTVRIKKPIMKKLTLEAECDKDISYYQLARVINKLKKGFESSECKISPQDNIHVVLRQCERR